MTVSKPAARKAFVHCHESYNWLLRLVGAPEASVAPHKTSVLAHIKGPNVNLIPQMLLQYNSNGMFVSQTNIASLIA